MVGDGVRCCLTSRRSSGRQGLIERILSVSQDVVICFSKLGKTSVGAQDSVYVHDAGLSSQTEFVHM